MPDSNRGLPGTVTSHDGTVRSVVDGAEAGCPRAPRAFSRVEECIGRGGLGIVYRAYDERLRRPVALKVLAKTSPVAESRLLDEARAAAALTHACIAAVHDVQNHGGINFIVMELVEGTTLRQEMRRGVMPPDTALRYARAIASGLARAHDSGIVHRDLKPENVMVTRDGNVKVLDFGLAREAPEEPPESSDPTSDRRSRQVRPATWRPSRRRGRRVDTRADVFSFGVVLWEMLSGAPSHRSPGAARTAPTCSPRAFQT